MSNNDIQKHYADFIKKIELKHEQEMKVKIEEERKKILDDVIKIKPELENEKEKLYDMIINSKKPVNLKKKVTQPIVVEQITLNGTNYYVDSFGSVWDDKAIPVGVVERYEDDKPICLLYNDKLADDINTFDIPKLDEN